MADFQEGFDQIVEIEGGYSDHPEDYGGETYKGISRNYHPNWEGWLVIDEIKEQEGKDFEKDLQANQELQGLVRSFYKTNFWDIFWGDHIQEQIIADELFDISVNLGTSKAIEFLQSSLNILNRNEKLYKDIATDGIMGENTFNALSVYFENDNPNYLYKVLNILQGYHYIQTMKNDQSQETFARGWLSRVFIFK